MTLAHYVKLCDPSSIARLHYHDLKPTLAILRTKNTPSSLPEFQLLSLICKYIKLYSMSLMDKLRDAAFHVLGFSTKKIIIRLRTMKKKQEGKG